MELATELCCGPTLQTRLTVHGRRSRQHTPKVGQRLVATRQVDEIGVVGSGSAVNYIARSGLNRPVLDGAPQPTTLLATTTLAQLGASHTCLR